MNDPVKEYESRRERFAILGPMTFEWIGAGTEEDPHRLTLTMSFYSAERDEAMVLDFDAVDLERFSPGSFSDTERLSIRSMKERGWEMARYRVLDIGEDWLAFYCGSISIRVEAIAEDGR
jgi:hypothetical protein